MLYRFVPGSTGEIRPYSPVASSRRRTPPCKFHLCVTVDGLGDCIALAGQVADGVPGTPSVSNYEQLDEIILTDWTSMRGMSWAAVVAEAVPAVVPDVVVPGRP